MFLSCDGLPPTVTIRPASHPVTSMPVQQQTARKWRLLNAGNSAPGAQGLTSRMDERVKGSLDPAKVLSGSISNHVLPTPCAYKLYAFTPYRVRHVPPIPILETAGERELKRLEEYETMLDDTSPSGTCDLQRKTAHHHAPPQQASPAFRAKKTIRAGCCDTRLDPRGRIPQALLF